MTQEKFDAACYTPKTVYVTYIAATPEQVWQALTDPAFTRQYFGGLAADVEPRTGGAFRLLVTYEIERSGESTRLTMTEAHDWDIPDAILAGGASGWPAILSSLKSVLETGKPLTVAMSMPDGMVEAAQKAVAEKPWLKR